MTFIRALVAFGIAAGITFLLFSFVETIPGMQQLDLFFYAGFFVLCLFILHNLVKR